MNDEFIRKYIEGMDTKAITELGNIVSRAGKLLVKDMNDKMAEQSDEVRSAYSKGKQMGTLEFMLKEYDKL